MGIKTVVFAKNGHGIKSIKIDTDTETVYSTRGVLPWVVGRHYHLIESGKRIEVLHRIGYVKIPADIKEIK